MKIVPVEKLGDRVSYGTGEIKVLRALYDKVPSDLRRDFEAILECAYTEYRSSVAEEKAKGNRPNAAFLKKKSLDKVRKWLSNHNILEEPIKRVVSPNPRIPKNNEIPRVVQKQTYLADVDPSKEEISTLFDNFNSEALNDEKVEIEEDQITVSLDDDLFDGTDLLDGLEEF